MTADDDVRRAMVRHATERLAFLTDAPERTEVRDEDGITTVQLVVPPIFVELELDWREEAVFTLVGALKGGRVPDGYYVDGDGQKVRWHLGDVLESHGRVSEAESLRSATAHSGQRAMSMQIDASAQALQASMSDLPRMIDRMSAAPPDA